MTIEQAFGHLIETNVYKDICKEKQGKGAKYRVYKGRYLKGELHALAMVAFLIDHDYIIKVESRKKKR